MKYKILSLLSLVLLAGCSNANIKPADPNPTPHDITEGGGVFTENGNILESFKGLGSKSDGTVGMLVNPYIWKSTIESISFMPLVQADSAGGVILSDWVEPKGDTNKQVKVNVYILGKKLSPTSLQVKVFERTKQEDGSYSVPTLDEATSNALEETILSNARALKIRTLAK